MDLCSASDPAAFPGCFRSVCPPLAPPAAAEPVEASRGPLHLFGQKFLASSGDSEASEAGGGFTVSGWGVTGSPVGLEHIRLQLLAPRCIIFLSDQPRKKHTSRTLTPGSSGRDPNGPEPAVRISVTVRREKEEPNRSSSTY